MCRAVSREDPSDGSRCAARCARPLFKKAPKRDSGSQAVAAHSPSSEAAWESAISALPPIQLALLIAFVKFEKDHMLNYNLEFSKKETHNTASSLSDTTDQCA